MSHSLRGTETLVKFGMYLLMVTSNSQYQEICDHVNQYHICSNIQYSHVKDFLTSTICTLDITIKN